MEPVVVEVKGLIKQGLSLFGTMMKTVDALEPGQSLIVKSTFNPAPLMAHMRRKGYRVQQEKTGRLIITTFIPNPPSTASNSQGAARVVDVSIEGPEHFLDNRGLTPPEPMQRTLGLLNEVPVNHVVVIHNDRVPVFLLGQLDDEEIPYEIRPQDDDSAVVRILKTHPLSG
ncbi:MAG: DUF2249 domain-containing protein [Firmicutes bacterium]|nr:DUF2249 domain-containing protein [Bacillota bacterium]